MLQKKQQFSINKKIWIYASVAIGICIVIYLFLGIYIPDIEEKIHAGTVQITVDDLNYSKLEDDGVLVKHSIDWGEAQNILPCSERMIVPCVTYVELNTGIGFDILERINENNRFTFVISNEPLIITKSRFSVQSAQVQGLNRPSLHLGKLLLSFVKEYIRNNQYKRNELPQVEILASQVPLNLDIVEEYARLKNSKYNYFLWAKFAFSDIRKVLNTSITSRVQGLDQFVLYKESSFKISRDYKKAKFGIKKQVIDEYGDVKPGSVEYKLVEIGLDENKTKYQLLSEQVIDKEIEDEMILALEAGFKFRVIVFVIAGIISLYILYKFLRMIYSFINKIFPSDKPQDEAKKPE